MDRADLEQELRFVIVKCLKGYRGDSSASFQTYLYRAMLNKLMVLRTKEAHRFKTSEKVLRNAARVNSLYEEIELLSDSRYNEDEREFMKAAMGGMTPKDIRKAFDLTVREFNKIRRVIGEKMLQADPELSSVLKLV
jgi:DNA-directed RNA polymerase specialized sigma24 family protein